MGLPPDAETLEMDGGAEPGAGLGLEKVPAQLHGGVSSPTVGWAGSCPALEPPER